MKHFAIALFMSSLFATGAVYAAQNDSQDANTQTAAVSGNQTSTSGEEDCD